MHTIFPTFTSIPRVEGGLCWPLPGASTGGTLFLDTQVFRPYICVFQTVTQSVLNTLVYKGEKNSKACSQRENTLKCRHDNINIIKYLYYRLSTPELSHRVMRRWSFSLHAIQRSQQRHLTLTSCIPWASDFTFLCLKDYIQTS